VLQQKMVIAAVSQNRLQPHLSGKKQKVFLTTTSQSPASFLNAGLEATYPAFAFLLWPLFPENGVSVPTHPLWRL